MNKFYHYLAIAFLIIWAISVFGFEAGNLIHLLLLFAFLFFIFGWVMNKKEI